MRFADIYESVVRIIGDSDVNIYVHIRNLCDEDKSFIIEQVKKDSRIKILKANTLDDFLLDSYDVDVTISVDTALLHFREGIKRPAIGIYGPFPSDCRTRYYKYTKSIEIESECDKMPCYIHVKKYDEVCDKQKELVKSGEFSNEFKFTAPCCCSKWNSSVIEQLTEKMRDYIIKNLK
jgi:ADP-heptose:LPS heptosyltransferase